MIKYFKSLIYLALISIIILGNMATSNYASDADYKIVQDKIDLPPLVPLAIKGLNGFLVKDQFGTPTYLVVLYAKVKNSAWKKDSLEVNRIKGLNSDQIDKIVADHPEYVYLNQKMVLKVIVKKLANGSTNQKNVRIPYFIISNLKENSQNQQQPLQQSMPFSGVRAIPLGKKLPSLTVPNYSQNNLVNNAASDDKSNLYLISQNNITVNLNNESSNTQYKNIAINLQFKANDYNNLELLIGFKLNQDQYNALQEYKNVKNQ